MSQEDRNQLLADLRLLRDEYLCMLHEVKCEERRTQLELLLRHINECLVEEESRS